MSVSVQPRPNSSPNASKEKRYPWTPRKSSRRRNMTSARHRLLDLTTNFRGSRSGPHTAHRESSCCRPLEYITDGRSLTFSDQEGGTLGGGHPTRHSTLHGSNAKGTSVLASERASACLERSVLNAEQPTETTLRSRVEQAEVAGNVTDSESTSQDRGVGTVLEKTLATAALVWVASDIAENRVPESETTVSSHSSTDVGTPSAIESIRTSVGESPRLVSVSGEECPPLSTPEPTCSESLRESSSQDVTDTCNADGSRLAANGSSRLHSSEAASIHDDVDASSSHGVQQETDGRFSGAQHPADTEVEGQFTGTQGEHGTSNRPSSRFALDS